MEIRGTRRFVRILWIGVAVAPGMAAAQAVPIPDWPIAAGSHVRILSPVLGDRHQIGDVVSATWDTLVFLPAKQSASTAIGTPNIITIEVAKGKHMQMGKGAVMGFLIFGGAGAFMANATYRDCHPNCLWVTSRRSETLTGGVLFGLLGAFAGAAVGSRQTDTWVPVAVPRR
jgi:hypothetical protein